MTTDVSPLCGDRFAPATSAIGFLELPLDEAVRSLVEWRRERHGGVEALPRTSDLRTNLAELGPLTGGSRPRELLVGCRGDRWTAYFDCSLQGTDAVSTVGHLSRSVGCQGVAVRYVRDVAASGSTPARLGAVQFELFAPLDTDFVNYVRTISVINVGGRWRFDANGLPQWFEDEERYNARQIRSRFTPEMLREYCRALEIDPFDEHSYGPNAVLIRTPSPPAPGGFEMTFQEAQAWLGITPDDDRGQGDDDA